MSKLFLLFLMTSLNLNVSSPFIPPSNNSLEQSLGPGKNSLNLSPSTFGEIEFNRLTSLDLNKIEHNAISSQSIHSARFAFQAAIERVRREYEENKDSDEIQSLVENTLTWHYRSLVLAERDKYLSKDPSADAAGWIFVDHGTRLSELSEIVDFSQLKSKKYIISAIKWTRDNMSSWPMESDQEISHFGMGFFTNNVRLIKKDSWQKMRLKSLHELENQLDDTTGFM